MADSQLACMDDDHVNEKVPESKPEFYYSEEQRGAVEQLLKNGDGAFRMRIKQDDIKEFLSSREIRRIRETFREYETDGEDKWGSEPAGAAGSKADSGVHSTYWPKMSDTEVPPLDIGWPDTGFYKGVTRVTVHTHPPKENGPHIKAVVRRLIQEARKVLAVVMDSLTDVQIFQDLLDASAKRGVAVYVVLDPAGVPQFTDMCHSLHINGKHLQNLRVRTVEGIGLALSFGKIPGALSSKYMLVDGEKVVSGSYSFTWTASRMDRNLITVMTGQVVDFFDHDFRELYAISLPVDLYKEMGVPAPSKPSPAPVKTESKPPTVPATSRFQAMDIHGGPPGNIRAPAHKYHNPKYSLVVGNTLGMSTSCQELAGNGGSSPGIMRRFLQGEKASSERADTVSPLPGPVAQDAEGKSGTKKPGGLSLKKQRSSIRFYLGRGKSAKQSEVAGSNATPPGNATPLRNATPPGNAGTNPALGRHPLQPSNSSQALEDSFEVVIKPETPLPTPDRKDKRGSKHVSRSVSLRTVSNVNGEGIQGSKEAVSRSNKRECILS